MCYDLNLSGSWVKWPLFIFIITTYTSNIFVQHSLLWMDDLMTEKCRKDVSNIRYYRIIIIFSHRYSILFLYEWFIYVYDKKRNHDIQLGQKPHSLKHNGNHFWVLYNTPGYGADLKLIWPSNRGVYKQVTFTYSWWQDALPRWCHCMSRVFPHFFISTVYVPWTTEFY